MEKRIRSAFLLIILIFTFLTCMLVKCMLFYDEESLTELSTQYYRVVETVYPRGDITDRYGIVLNKSGGEVLDYVNRTLLSYPDTASQVIGTVQTDIYDTTKSSAKGVNGINYIFDELLNGGSPIKVNAIADANSNILTYMPVSVVGDHINEGCNITLTLDSLLQRKTEEIMKEFASENNFVRMCAMLTDASTGEILVMATYGTEMNMNVLSYQPGSVIKIIAAACALDEGLISAEDEFICNGTFSVGEETRSCSGGAVHGKTTMKKAFASSCNHWAYEINKALTYASSDGTIKSKMLDMAKEWGFSDMGDERREFMLSYSGYYSFAPDVLYNEMDIFNSALGQGNIQASVYLINKITSAIANGGETFVPYIVSTITDPAGNTVFFSETDKTTFDLGLKRATVEQLRTFMREVCISGSARKINTENVSGKTGTSENIKGSECHSWFTGYFPHDNTTYSLTVFVENGGNAPQSAVPLFDMIADCVIKQR